MTLKKNKSSLLLTLGTAAFLVGGGTAAYLVLVNRNLGPGELPVGSNIIPQDALMTVSVSTEPGQWENLRTFGTKQTQAQLDQTLAQLRDRFLTANGFDYQRDIKPWIGKEATIALLATPQAQPAQSPAPSLPPVPRTTSPQAVVAVLPIQDPVQAKQILDNPKAPAAATLVERNYKGVQIRETQGAAPGYSAAVLDGKFVVVTTNPKATERAIDTYKGGAAISSTPGYSESLGQIQTGQPFARLFVNTPVAAANPARGLSSQNLAKIQQNQQGLAATINLKSEGIEFKGISWMKPNSERKFEVKNTAKIMPSRLPSDTLMMASGGNLKRLWQDYSQGVTSNPITPMTPIDPQGLRAGLKSTVNLDLEQDLLSWMDGEFALAMLPAPQGAPPSLPLGIVLMVKASDRRVAENTFKQLDEVMSSKYKFKVEPAKVGGEPVVNWILPGGGLTITHGWMDGDLAFLSLGAPVTSAFVPKASSTLAESDLFKQAVPSQLNPKNGHFFVDIERTLKSLPLLPLPAGNKALTDAIRSIGVTAAIHSERSVRYDILVLLQKAEKPGPLPSPGTPPASPLPPTPEAVPSPSP